MINFLNDIRNAENPISNNRKLINTIALLFLGIALGSFSKYLDFRQAELPSAARALEARGEPGQRRMRRGCRR